MTLEELAELFKKIFCPFIAVATPLLYIMVAFAVVRDLKSGVPLPMGWDVLFIFAFTLWGFIWSIYVCYFEFGWFNKNKGKPEL